MSKKRRQQTHVTWSIERDGRCPSCRVVTILVSAPSLWSVPDQERTPKPLPDVADVHEEITGHWCPKCERLVSLSLNT